MHLMSQRSSLITVNSSRLFLGGFTRIEPYVRLPVPLLTDVRTLSLLLQSIYLKTRESLEPTVPLKKDEMRT